MIVPTPNSKLQTIRNGILLVASIVVCLLWASIIPEMLQHHSYPAAIMGHSLAYFVLLCGYLFSVVVLVLGIGHSLFALLKKSRGPLQSNKSLLAIVGLWWALVFILCLSQREALSPLKYRGTDIALFITTTLTLIFIFDYSIYGFSKNKYKSVIIQIIIIIFLLMFYVGIEILSHYIIEQNPVIDEYITQLYPASPDPVPPDSASPDPASPDPSPLAPVIGISDCLSGCAEYALATNTYIDSIIRVAYPGKYDVIHEYNNMGLRGPDTSYESDKYRILILGDSYIEAYAIGNKDTVGLQLQALLNDLSSATGPEYEVLQFGKSAAFIVQLYQYYYNEGVKFQPDLVLYVQTPSDFFEANSVYFFPREYWSLYKIDDGNISHDEVPLMLPTVSHFIETVGRRLYDYHIRTQLIQLMVVAPLLDRIASGAVPTKNMRESSYDELVNDPGVEKAEQISRDIFSTWQQRLQDDDTDFAIIHVAQHVSYATGEFVVNMDRLNNDMLSGLDIPVIDTLEPFHTAIQNGIEIDFYNEFGDNHLNSQGNHELAVVIFDWLVEQGIVEEE
ncbi:hypothetical protein ACFLYO_11265, partial [Chloroflexota bacterium]